jgi:16S rRNA (guanine527-N7)-methyltransferase
MSGSAHAAMAPPAEFHDACRAYGIEFEPGDLDKLQRYLEMLLETNKRFNLTSITKPAEAWMRHIFDSLTLLPFIAESEDESMIDVGSGGGLPGVPLAIVLPEVDVTLLEATGKKARFLEDVVAALELANVEVVCQRAEAAGRDREQFREKFDVVTARAVGPLNALLELTTPFARVGGLVLAMKGAKAAEEIAAAAGAGVVTGALKKLKCEVVATHEAGAGVIVAIEKVGQTPKMYPRGPGEPKRNPL